jgi:hypothetical protein
MRRRQLLTATAIGIAGIAGCSSDSDGEAASPTQTSSSGPLSSPENTVQTFYDTLYGDDDIEGANELYHPDSQAPPLSESNFEPFGGVSAISATLQSTETISETETTTEIHATVDYSSPAGTATQVDWFELQTQDGEWRVMSFYPESARNAATGTPSGTATETPTGTSNDSA